MARRLSDKQKSELLKKFQAGVSTSVLADQFGCSPITVSRTVKGLLSAEEYSAIKAFRSKRGNQSNIDSFENLSSATMDLDDLGSSSVDDPVALGNAEVTDERGKELKVEENDLENVFEEDSSEDDDIVLSSGDDQTFSPFTELVPFGDITDFDEKKEIEVKPLNSGALPRSAYMLVDKSDELDIQPLKLFSGLGPLSDSELERNALYLFTTPRMARRQCGRSQRVIKIPDTQVFLLSVDYLLAKGITRLVLEGSLIALDQ